MTTYSGKQISLLNPSIEDIDLSDIVHSLCAQKRFLGHPERCITVAHHSVLVAKRIDPNKPRLRMAALMHDSHEAYTGDITSPMKEAICAFCDCDPIKKIQDKLDSLIFKKFFVGILNDEEKSQIKKADDYILAKEAHLGYRPKDVPDWAHAILNFKDIETTINFNLTPTHVREMFISEFQRLTKAMILQ